MAVIGWGVIVAVHLQRADRSLRAGITAAQRVRSELSSRDLTQGAAAADLAAAEHSFALAHAAIASRWLAPLHVLPVIGTQVRSVEDLSGAAQVVTTSGATALATVRTVLSAGHRTATGRAAEMRLLAATVADLEKKVSGVSLGPAHGLVGALVARRDTFAADLVKLHTGLVRAGGVTAALADLLTGPRTYLVAATNNAEMRAGSGMILQAGTLTVSEGALRLGPVVPTDQLVAPATPVRASGDLAGRWGFENPAVDFRELLLSPQFPPNAALAAEMWQQRTGRHIDGMITVDVAALADILAATGPVTAAGETFTSSDVTAKLLVGQYTDLGTSQANDARREKLGVLAARVFAASQDGRTSLTALLKAFDTAILGRHMLVWAATPRIEADWAAAGIDGTIGGNDILLSLLNQGANKLDPYQRVTSRLSAESGPGATEVTVRVTVHNATPATLTGYAAGGSGGDLSARQYRGAVELDLPRQAEAVTSSGGPVESAGSDYGAMLCAVQVAIARGRSQTVVFRFRLAGSSGRFHVVASARLPATAWSWTAPGGTSEQFTDGTEHQLSW